MMFLKHCNALYYSINAQMWHHEWMDKVFGINFYCETSNSLEENFHLTHKCWNIIALVLQITFPMHVLWIMEFKCFISIKMSLKFIPRISVNSKSLLVLSSVTWTFSLNSLAPGKFEWNFRYLIFQILSVIDGWVVSCELALRWMSLDLTDDKSTLVQVMAWCRQATSHYLTQCWPRSLPPYGVTRPQWAHTPLVPHMRQWTGSGLVQVMACRQFSAKTLP